MTSNSSSWRLRAAVALLACATLSSAAVAEESTVQDFAADFPAAPEPQLRALQQTGEGAAPGIQENGWDGNFLRMTTAVNGQSTRFHYRQLNEPGENISLEFEMRISVGNGGGADGMSVALANTGSFGTETSTTPPVFAEEPNLTGSLGVGFDTFNNTDLGDGGENTISIHYNGVVLSSTPIDGTDLGTFENGMVMLVRIEIEETNVSVTLENTETGDLVVVEQVVDELVPYPFRLIFGARTGGANSDQDLDNIRLEVDGEEVLQETFDDPIIAPEIPPAEPIGGTPYVLIRGANNSVPGPEVLPDSGVLPDEQGEGEGFLRLAHEIGNQNGTILFDQTCDCASEVTANFLYRGLDQGQAGRADGAAFLLLDVDVHGRSGVPEGFAPVGAWEEPNLAGAFGVGFDTFSNDVDDNGPDGIASPGLNVGNHLSLHWDGVRVAVAGIDQADLDLVNNEWNEVTIEVLEAEGVVAGEPTGSVVTVSIVDGTDGSVHLVFDEFFIPGMVFPSGARVGFGARTGGAADNYDIDDVNVTFCDPIEPPVDGFVRGDSDSNGSVQLTDGVVSLNFLFTGGPAPGCFDAADANDDGRLNIADASYVFGWLFTGGPVPPAPSPTSASNYPGTDCGADPTADDLDCASKAAVCRSA